MTNTNTVAPIGADGPNTPYPDLPTTLLALIVASNVVNCDRQ
jgi:hypothetical protein